MSSELGKTCARNRAIAHNNFNLIILHLRLQFLLHFREFLLSHCTFSFT